jgi:hypothetical protein
VLLCTSLGPGAQQGERRLGRNTGNSPEKRPGRNTGNPLGGNLAVTQVTAWGKPGRNTGESLGGGGHLAGTQVLKWGGEQTGTLVTS